MGGSKQCLICHDNAAPLFVLNCCGDGVTHRLKTWCRVCMIQAAQTGRDYQCPFCRASLPAPLKWSLMADKFLQKRTAARTGGLAEGQQSSGRQHGAVEFHFVLRFG